LFHSRYPINLELNAQGQAVSVCGGSFWTLPKDLRDAVKDQNRHVSNLGSRIAARFAKAGLTTELPELHGQAPQAVKFTK
jgi:hypothetical protein